MRGENVYANNFRPGDTETWLPAVIIKRYGPRNFTVSLIQENVVWRRHADHLRPRHALDSPKSSTAERSLVESEFQSETTNLPNELSWEMGNVIIHHSEPDLPLVARSLPDEMSASTPSTQVEPVATASPHQAERVVRATSPHMTSPEQVVLGSRAYTVLSPTNRGFPTTLQRRIFYISICFPLKKNFF